VKWNFHIVVSVDFTYWLYLLHQLLLMLLWQLMCWKETSHFSVGFPEDSLFTVVKYWLVLCACFSMLDIQLNQLDSVFYMHACVIWKVQLCSAWNWLSLSSMWSYTVIYLKLYILDRGPAFQWWFCWSWLIFCWVYIHTAELQAALS